MLFAKRLGVHSLARGDGQGNFVFFKKILTRVSNGIVKGV